MSVSPELAWELLQTAVTIGAMWGIVRTELRYHRRDLDRLRDELDELMRARFTAADVHSLNSRRAKPR